MVKRIRLDQVVYVYQLHLITLEEPVLKEGHKRLLYGDNANGLCFRTNALHVDEDSSSHTMNFFDTGPVSPSLLTTKTLAY